MRQTGTAGAYNIQLETSLAAGAHAVMVRCFQENSTSVLATELLSDRNGCYVKRQTAWG